MGKDIPDSIKLIIFEESDFQCAYCGYREGLNLTAHHIIPKEKGGKATYDNLITLCHNCQNNVHKSRKITVKEIRRLKRHLVKRYLTQQGVNALKQAYLHDYVTVPPTLVNHLVERKLLKYKEYQMSDDKFGILVVYTITDKGKELAEKWVLNKDELKKKPKENIKRGKGKASK